MHRTPLTIAAVAVAAALAAAAPARAADAPPTRPITVTGTMQLVSFTGEGRYVVRGPVDSKGLGPGTATYMSTVKGEDVRGTVVARFAHGTIRTSMRGRFVLAPSDGVIGRTTGRGRIVGATGAYRGTTGRFTFTGLSRTDGSTDMVLRGRVRPSGR